MALPSALTPVLLRDVWFVLAMLYEGGEEGTQGLGAHLRTARFGLRTGKLKLKARMKKTEGGSAGGPTALRCRDVGAGSTRTNERRKPSSFRCVDIGTGSAKTKERGKRGSAEKRDGWHWKHEAYICRKRERSEFERCWGPREYRNADLG